MKSTSTLAAALSLLLLALACAPATPTATVPVEDLVGTAVAQTQTAEAAETAPPVETTEPPPPLPTATDTPVPDVTAPSPLSAMYTGIVIADGECYDLDDGNAPYVLDGDCDILLVYPQILRTQNGALLSGHATLDAPSRNDCSAAVFDGGDLAPNTDLYICFKSDEGHYGFIVQRHDGAPFDVASHRLVIDWWVYE